MDKCEDNNLHLMHVRTKIITMWMSGSKKIEIIKETGYSLSKINKWIKRYEDEGEKGLVDKRKSNKRPRKTTLDDDKKLYRAAKSDNFNSSASFAVTNDLNISSDTVKRRLKEQGLVNGRTCKKIELSELSRTRRVEHCWKYLHWTQEQWNDVIWSDEKVYFVYF